MSYLFFNHIGQMAAAGLGHPWEPGRLPALSLPCIPRGPWAGRKCLLCSGAVMRGDVSESTGAGRAGSQRPGRCLDNTNTWALVKNTKPQASPLKLGLRHLHVFDTRSSLSIFASSVLEVKRELR